MTKLIQENCTKKQTNSRSPKPQPLRPHEDVVIVQPEAVPLHALRVEGPAEEVAPRGLGAVEVRLAHVLAALDEPEHRLQLAPALQLAALLPLDRVSQGRELRVLEQLVLPLVPLGLLVPLHCLPRARRALPLVWLCSFRFIISIVCPEPVLAKQQF